jgi:tRNA pseudouridine13 synthase
MGLLPSLPYLTNHLPGTGGNISELCEDFIVEEIPVYEPEGYGEHLFINITRKEMTTREVALQLARLFEVPFTSIGYAGLKDKFSISTQTFSVHLKKTDPRTPGEIWDLICLRLPMKVNWLKRHPRKLRIGHLYENRFTINITRIEIGIAEAFLRAQKIANSLKEHGLPNFYGPQRVDEKNVRRGREILKGIRYIKNRWLKRFLVTSFIDHLCNQYLVERNRRGFFSHLVEGDIAKKYTTGGMFIVEDLEVDQPRYEAKEISFTAPLFGPKMWEAEGPSWKLEQEILRRAEIQIDELNQLNIRGSRRLGRLLPDVRVEPTNRGIQLQFSLPKGAYATIILREIMKNWG